MPDVYASITQADRALQERLADLIELRAADPGYQSMVREYLAKVGFPPHAQVLEIGCGTGSITRMLATWPNVERALGIDPSPVFIERARRLSTAVPNIAFEEGDGRQLPLEADRFDAVVVNTTLSHVPQAERLVAEAHRVLKPGGWFAAFDGDYATTTVARNELDPLQACIAAFRTRFVNDPWLVRRLPQLVRSAGFETATVSSHGYVEAPSGSYMLTLIERGADVLAQEGCIGQPLAEALKAESKRRSLENAWFGHIAFASMIARKPAHSL